LRLASLVAVHLLPFGQVRCTHLDTAKRQGTWSTRR
jgi:hypothetical protein